MKAGLALAAAAVMIAANPATATTTVAYSFNTTGNTAENGTYGKSMIFTTANKPSSLQMSVTAWQANLLTGAITSAYLGAYGGGLGVTGAGDNRGAGGQHQIDNVGGYADFLLLEFNEAVTLASVKTNSYGITGISGLHSDAVWADLSGFATPAWDSTAGFGARAIQPASAGVVADPNAFGWRLTGATTASTKWMVAASPVPLWDDGFKLASVTVAEQVASVPEPATWLTMILGFGVAGGALRRGRRGRTPAAALA